MNIPLYEMTKELQEIHNLVLDGELTEAEVEDTLEALEGEFKQKAVMVGRFMLNLNPTVDALDKEIDRLKKRRDSIKGKQDSVKNYLRNNMLATGINKIECELFTVLCKKPQQVVCIDDKSALPEEFTNVKTTITPNKIAIKKAIKDGGNVTGASLKAGQAPIEIK